MTLVEATTSNEHSLYQRLAPWQTRILRIHPSRDFHSVLTCDLLTADIIQLPGIGLVQDFQIVEYEALSYSWGYPAPTKSIRCSNRDVPVSENLYDALRHIRRTDSVRYLWTDACCINQSDLAEKSHQVSMMLTIFQKATESTGMARHAVCGRRDIFQHH